MNIKRHFELYAQFDSEIAKLCEKHWVAVLGEFAKDVVRKDDGFMWAGINTSEDEPYVFLQCKIEPSGEVSIQIDLESLVEFLEKLESK